MPELPEVETVRLGLNQVTPGQRLVGGEVLLPRTIASPTPQQFLQGLQDTILFTWHRRGKYLLAELRTQKRSEPAGWWGVHLRMTGQLLWVAQSDPLPKHTRVRLFFPKNRELRFVDTRTFGQMWWVPPDQPPEAIMTTLAKLGPEPFTDDFSGAYLAARLRRSQRPIKSALLDQTLVAGIGNIYADEALFLSGIRPTAIAAQLSARQCETLHHNIVNVLQQSIRAGGTTFSDFRNLEGINGNYGGEAWVYGRDGQTCRQCGTPIERLKLAGRSSHFCPHCQS